MRGFAKMGQSRTLSRWASPILLETRMEPDLDRFRDYLRLLARLHMGAGLKARVDPSDLVQETLLDAHKGRAQFKGTTDAELMAWLRTTLAHNLADAAKALKKAKRDVALERSIEAELGQSTARLGDWLVIVSQGTALRSSTKIA